MPSTWPSEFGPRSLIYKMLYLDVAVDSKEVYTESHGFDGASSKGAQTSQCSD